MPRELTREETYAAFDLETDLRLQVIDYLETIHPGEIQRENEIHRCLINDIIWQKMQIEREDYDVAISKYNLVEDEYVLRRSEEVEERISEEMRQYLIEPMINAPQDDNISAHIDSQLMSGPDDGDDFADNSVDG